MSEPAALYRVVNRRTGRSLASSVVIATSLRQRLVGLLGRRALAPGEGLRIDPCTSIHMFFMSFAIDAVFTDRQDRVVRVVPDLRPWRIALGGRTAATVLELAVGAIESSGTRPGDFLAILPTSDESA